MTPSPARLREMVGEEPRYLLVKRDLYYAPNNHGYTGVKARAGRYHSSEADPESGVTAIHEDDAPMFAKACWQDVQVKVLLDEIDVRDRRIAELEGALEPFAREADAQERVTSYRDGDCLIVRTNITVGALRRARAALEARS